MKLKKILEGSALRIVLFILAAVTMGSFIIASIADGINNRQQFQKINLQQSAFNEMLKSLEFKGLEGESKEKIGAYASQSDESMNVIITDDAGKVLYHLNNGYMAEPDQFLVVVNPQEALPNEALIIDSKNSLRYQVRLNQADNGFKLVEKSANSDAARTLFPEETDQVNPKGFISPKGLVNPKSLVNPQSLERGFRVEKRMEVTSVIPGRVRLFGSNLSNIMNYAYIGSKGWHVYSIYKDTGAYDYKFSSWQDRLVKYLKSLTLGAFLLFWFLLPLWVFHDAQKREFKPALWGILVLVINIVGLIIYLVVRPELVVCKQCGAQLNPKFVSCPNCGAQNRERCVSCKQIIEKNWVACPYCGQLKSGIEVNTNSVS